ncbi:MAG: transcriptional regulator GcvA [Alphaproteobacteria bacterium]|nr:transcriptional regulator GcvA [Alphaproteobacteria bacterium]
MPRDLPPLNALRAFEAAARHLSFTKAAEELLVTPAAVSQQVKLLEGKLGVALFQRLNRGLLLTDAGRSGLPGLSDSFERLADSVHRLRGWKDRVIVTVRVPPSLGVKWLVPRLVAFHAAQPEIDVRISIAEPSAGFTWTDCELEVRNVPGHYAGLKVERLMSEEIFPVCSPRLMKGRSPLRAPADLADHTLIHDESLRVIEDFPTWQRWLDVAGVSGVDVTRGLHFSYSSMAIDAAIAGDGVALGRTVIVADDLAAGRLVRPFDVKYPARFHYHLLSDRRANQEPNIRAVRDWLLAIAQQAPS